MFDSGSEMSIMDTTKNFAKVEKNSEVHEHIPDYGFDCKLASNDLDDCNNDITSTCKFCNESIVGPPLYWETGSVILTGALVDHMKLCQKFLAYQIRAAKFATEWKEYLKKHDMIL